MSFQPLSFLSGLAYLALCLLIAASGARKKCLRDGLSGSEFTIRHWAGENGGRFLSFVSCLISLSSFLLMPCGTFPSLFPVSGGALIVIGALAVAPGFRGGWKWARRQGIAPLFLGVSLAVIARHARQRGVPGDPYALDAYVSMPIIGVAEGTEKAAVCILAVVSLLALRKALPARRFLAFGENFLRDGDAFPGALAAELWMLAVVGFWVCLFFPYSFTHRPVSEISALGGLALNALIFWGKVLGLKWLLGSLREKWPRDPPLHVWVLFALLGLGVWPLLFDAMAV
ncbi:MAG: hypothetical protein LBD06_08215 [Candidatus Accumulibacter sp.]|nr:hypothetical protein [Accumulibacter sp.]